MKQNETKLYSAKANILKALAHPTRLWIVEKLAKKEQCVCEFAQKIDADFSTVSKHLTVLKQAGVIEYEKRGKNVYYSLKVPCILNFIGCIEKVVKEQIKSQIAILK